MSLLNRLFALSFIFVLFCGIAFSFENNPDIKKEVSKLQGLDNSGTEFWFSIPPCYEDETANLNLIKVFVISNIKTFVTLEIEGVGYRKTQTVIPNEVMEFNLLPSQGSPWTKTGGAGTPYEAIYAKKGIHVYSSFPIIVYCVVRYHYTSDGFLVSPVSTLGKEYIISAPAVDAMFDAVWDYKFPATTCITAAYDQTKVRFTLGGNVLTKTPGGINSGESKEWTLNRGDVLAISTDVNESDLSGSKVESTKPFSVVTGNFCANIPTGNQWCDYTVEMDLPTHIWGNFCHVGKIPNRKFASEVKIFAKEPNTKIYRNGLNIGSLQQSGGFEGKGYLYMRMTPDRKPGNAVFSGDKPINVTLFNTSVQEDGYPLPNSDPFAMATIPDEQFQKEIMFGTPGIKGGQGYPENYLNLIYQTDSSGKMPDHFEFAGPLNGSEIKWVRLNTKFPGVDELFIFDVGGKKYAQKTITLPGDGVYKIKANTPFAAYSYGYSYCDSYGFPASANLNDLDVIDTVCPVPTYTVKCDGSVDDGSVTDMPDDSTVRSNLSNIILDPDSSFNYQLSNDELVPGETRTTRWRLRVLDLTKDAKAKIVFVDRRGNETTIIIEYLSPKLVIKPNIIDFGILNPGESKTLYFFVVNESDQSSAVLKDLKLQSALPDFTISGFDPLPALIGKKDSVMFKLTFNPTHAGTFRDSLGLEDTCTSYNQVLVHGRAGNVQINVTDVQFDTNIIGKSQIKEFNITNEGNVELIVSGSSGPNLPVFKCNQDSIFQNSKLVLAPNESKIFSVEFKSDNVGKFQDSIVFSSDAGTNRKNVCYINAEAIPIGLYANSYDWGKMRINGYYPAEQSNPVLVIKNEKNAAVTIDDFTVLNNKRGNAFQFDIASIKNGLIIQPGNSATIPVVFHPVELGIHELKISFVNSAGIELISTLKGVGVAPKLAGYNYDFDTTGVNSTKEKVRRKIMFRNMEYATDTSVSDTVTIFGFYISEQGMVNTSEDKYNPNAWYFNQSAINLPVILNPKDSLVFDVYFVAQKYGLHSVDVTTISSALKEVTSRWVGNGGLNTSVDYFSISSNELQINPNPMGADGGELTYSVSQDGFTRIALYSINGELLDVLLSKFMEKGEHCLPVSCGALSSGVYKIVLISNGVKQEKTLHLIK